MQNKAIEWGMEALQTASEISMTADKAGIPGLGLLGMFAQTYYSKFMEGRFESFCNSCEIDEIFIRKILNSDTHANCFYGILEAVRRTHSNIGLAALALIYKEYWYNENMLLPALRAFAEIDDSTLLAFIELYEEIPTDTDYLVLIKANPSTEAQEFHGRYIEAVELIRRGFFVQSASMTMAQNFPIQGTKFTHTDLYYKHTKNAIQITNKSNAK